MEFLLEIEMNMTLALDTNIEMKMTLLVLVMNIELLPEVHGDANAVVGGQLVHMTEVQLLNRNKIADVMVYSICNYLYDVHVNVNVSLSSNGLQTNLQKAIL